MESNANKSSDNLKSTNSSRNSIRKNSQQKRNPKSNEGKQDREQDVASLAKDFQTTTNSNLNKKTSGVKTKNKKKDANAMKGKNNKDIDNKKRRKQTNNTSHGNTDKRRPFNDQKKDAQNKNNKPSQDEPNKNSITKSKSRSKAKSYSNTSNKNSRNNSSRKRRRNRSKDSDTLQFRIVVRLLPPNLDEISFLNEIKKTLNNNSFIKEYGIVDYYFVQGHYSIRAFNEPTYSRAYFTFLNMKQLMLFTEKISSIVFVDDRDTAMKPRIRMTSYVKNLSRDKDVETDIKNITENIVEASKITNKNSKNGKSLENTLNSDKIYQTFLKSLSILETAEDSDYLLDGSISLLRPLNNELIRQKRVNEGIEKKRENALIELAGSLKKDKKKKKKNKDKNKKKKKNDSLDDQSSMKRGKRRKKKAKAKNSSNGSEGNLHSKYRLEKQNKKESNNNNIVILEAAGKKELQKRLKLQRQKELERGKEKQKEREEEVHVEKKDGVIPSKFNINSQPFVPASINKTSKINPSQVTLLKREDPI